jgi:predicted enzyme related to lactoylglutathione lyase
VLEHFRIDWSPLAFEVRYDVRLPGTMADRSYTLFSAGPMMVGGMMPISEEARAMGARPAWNGYVLVDEVDVYADRVKADGGAIHRAPEDNPGVGQ